MYLPSTYAITIAYQDAKIKEGTSISAKKEKQKKNNCYNKMINWQARGSNRHGMQLHAYKYLLELWCIHSMNKSHSPTSLLLPATLPSLLLHDGF